MFLKKNFFSFLNAIVRHLLSAVLSLIFDATFEMIINKSEQGVIRIVQQDIRIEYYNGHKNNKILDRKIANLV